MGDCLLRIAQIHTHKVKMEQQHYYNKTYYVFDYFTYMNEKINSKYATYCEQVMHNYYKCVRDNNTCDIKMFDYDKKFNNMCSTFTSR